MKKTIVHVIESLSKGGAENLLVGYINSSDEYKHVIVILNSSNQFEFINAEVINLNYKGGVSYFWALFKLINVFYKLKPSIIHSHLFKAVTIARIAYFFSFFSVKFIYSIHSTYSKAPLNKKYYLYLERLLTTSSQTVVAVSKTVLKDYSSLINLDKNNKHVLYNFIDDTFFEESKIDNNSEIIRILAVGNLKYEKNYEYLLESFAKTKTQKSVQLDIYGDGPLKYKLEKMIIDLGLNEIVFLKGFSNNIASLLENYHVFIQCSLHEGFGISILEAMAKKNIVIVSDIEVLREVTNNNAWYLDLNDTSSLNTILNSIVKTRTSEIEINKFDNYSFAKQLALRDNFVVKLNNIYSSLLH